MGRAAIAGIARRLADIADELCYEADLQDNYALSQVGVELGWIAMKIRREVEGPIKDVPTRVCRIRQVPTRA